MTRYHCLTCLGSYSDLQEDSAGSRYGYFHVCPNQIILPVGSPRVGVLIAAGARQISSEPAIGVTLDIGPIRRDERIEEERSPGGELLMEPDPVKAKHWRSRRHIRAEGLGREVI